MNRSLGMLALLAALLGATPAPTGGQPPDSATAAGRDSVATAATAPAATEDPAARRYLNACAGCHRLEGAKLNGPALSHVAAWPPEQLRAAIKRMEKNTGPITDGDIDLLGDFLRAPDARTRLSLQEEKVRAQFAAKLAPPDRNVGRRLFHGGQPLANGGMACVACHSVAGVGGRLGPDLTDAATRLGRTPLMSGISGAAYRVMAPHYRKHPITLQEAAHITEYLAQPATPVAATARPGILALGTGGAAIAFMGLAFYYRRGRPARGAAAIRSGGV